MGLDAGSLISVSCERSQVANSESSTISASANISVPTIATGNETAPLSLIAVIDISYSMMGSRIELAKKTLTFIANQLSPKDKFSVVTFGSNANTIFPLTNVTSDNRSQIFRDITNIAPNGCTALSDGLFEGIARLNMAPLEHTASIMLLTDGQANIGITTKEPLIIEMQRKLANMNREATVFTFGYGNDHNADFLRAISDCANGMYYYIQRTDQIESAFAECLGGVSSVALRSVSLSISPFNKTIVERVLADLPTEKNENKTILQLGSLSSGENRNIPFEIKLPKLNTPNDESQKQIELILSYTTTSGKTEESKCQLYISRPSKSNCSDEKSDDYIQIDEQRNRVQVAETLKNVISLGESGNLGKARTVLKDLLVDLQKSPSSSSPFTLSLIEDVRESMDTLSDPSTFKNVGIKYLYSLSRSHYQQRASGVSSSAASAYLTDGQREMLQALTGKPVEKKSTTAPTSTKSTPTSTSTSNQTTQTSTTSTSSTTTTVQSQSTENEENKVSQGRLARGVRRLIADLAEIKKHPLPCVTAEPLESDVFEWHCNMTAPKGNPYHQIIFHIIMQFPHTYPFNPPKLYFCSYLKHDHVFKTWICLDMLQEFEWSSKSEIDTPYTGWTTAYSVHSVLLQLQSFLFDKANVSASEVQKAKDSALKFTCKTCSHSGPSKRYFPSLPENLSLENQNNNLTSIATVRNNVHNQKPLPELVKKSIIIRNNSNNQPQVVNQQKSVQPIDNNQQKQQLDNKNDKKQQKLEKDDDDDWSVVVIKSKGKKNKKSNGKLPKIKTNQSKVNSSSIVTANRFLDLPDEKSQPISTPIVQKVQQQQPEQKIENEKATSDKLSKKISLDDDHMELSSNSNASRKKNAKRRRKLKRIKEQKAEQVRQVQLQKEKAEREAEKLRKEQQEAKNEEEKIKKQKEIQRKEEEKRKAAEQLKKVEGFERKEVFVLETLSETLKKQQSKARNSNLGLHSSLFVFLTEKLMKEIFSYLSVIDLISISKCCRVFHNVSNDSLLWKNLCFRYFKNYIDFNSSLHPKIQFGREVLSTKAQLFCFHTRKTFEEDILGIPISYERNPRTKKIQYISTTLDLLSREGFYEDVVRKSVWKRPFTHWLPLYITDHHANLSWKYIQSSMAKLCDAKEFKPWMVLDVLPKLMNTMVVSVMSGETHASIVAIEGYCAFHHLLLKMIKKFPELSKRIDSTIRNFIKDENARTKNNTPSLGDFIPLLTVSEQFSWFDVRSAYVQENFDRNALWVIKKYPALQNVDRSYSSQSHVNQSRLNNTFDANRTSVRLLMFHVYFLTNIARPDGRSLNEVTSNYDLFFGRPTTQMKEDLQAHCKRVLAVQNWPDFFRLIGMKVPSPQNVTFVLNQAVVNSKRKGYHR